MKKIILLLLFTLSLFAEAKPYLGFNYGYTAEDFTTTETTDAQISSQFLNIGAGYGRRNAYAVEIYLEYVQNKSKIFSSDPTTKYDGDKYALNVDLVKSFDLDIYVIPFIKAGFGAGFLKVNRTLDDRISFGSFNLGTGFYIPVSEHYDLELGYRYKSFSFEGLELISQNIVHTSRSNSAYFGFNIRY